VQAQWCAAAGLVFKTTLKMACAQNSMTKIGLKVETQFEFVGCKFRRCFVNYQLKVTDNLMYNYVDFFAIGSLQKFLNFLKRVCKKSIVHIKSIVHKINSACDKLLW
jgi:hypothetical protein